jgi:hypothetical protein
VYSGAQNIFYCILKGLNGVSEMRVFLGKCNKK